MQEENLQDEKYSKMTDRDILVEMLITMRQILYCVERNEKRLIVMQGENNNQPL